MDAGAVGPGAGIDAVIVDDHPAVASGVAEWCAAAEPPVRLLDAEGRLGRVYTEPGRSADVVILDLQLDGGGPPVFRELDRLVEQGRRVIVYSHRSDAETALHCLELGAATYLTKAEGREHLIPAVRAVAEDRPYAAPSLGGAMTRGSTRPGLSERELAVLRAWFASDSKTLVGQRLNLSAKSVETYIARVRVKYANLGRAAPTKAALVARALQDGLVDLDEL